jgi:hypothetical protein
VAEVPAETCDCGLNRFPLPGTMAAGVRLVPVEAGYAAELRLGCGCGCGAVAVVCWYHGPPLGGCDNPVPVEVNHQATR